MAENTEGAALSVLVADDKGWSDQAMRAALSGRGFEIVHVAGVEAALGALSRREKPFSFVLTSVEMLDGSGLEILQAAHKRSASTQVLFVADRATFEVALEATQRGAYDFIVPGHGTRRVALLRLWQATASQPIDFAAFSRGAEPCAACSAGRGLASCRHTTGCRDARTGC